MFSRPRLRASSVLTDMRARAGVYKRVDAVRSELDDWVQCEHDRQAMSDAVFFDLYYGENSAGGTSKAGEQHIEDLRLAQSMLMQHYPDCAPLRDLIGKIDLAVRSLEKLR
ncbi:mlr9344 (plasmid) [Mesorhizobium japonicum MAFF 303099]|uniref:Mlr9344 protein n=1 Tax=Mesorhizobium japonicum (strain LMG 29417 / CECT 9101 / MAFF 303099) TaxID=266835 RepID=Q981J8_RHILO|nr:mlr9344 [Mesorhizobium japonicum MAFF 303099]